MVVKSHNSFDTARDIKYTSQNYCDKTLDDKMAISGMLFSDLYKITVNKFTFVGFMGDKCPLDPPYFELWGSTGQN